MKCESCGAEVPEDQITTIDNNGKMKVCLDCSDAFHWNLEH